jgi:glycogen phosphorylase
MPDQLKNEAESKWVTVHKDMSTKGIKISFQNNRLCGIAKDRYTATVYDNFMALAAAVRDRLAERWISTQRNYHKNNTKRVYYLSMEFLIGRLMGNYILNMGLWDAAKEALSELDIDIEDIRGQELDAGLGNGGLGRLAACFLDSMATLGIPCHGYGIRYDYGIFNQKIVNGRQVELPDEWLRLGNPWEFPRPEYTVKIRFGGRTCMFRDRNGHLFVQWVDTEDVLAVPYDIPIPGYGNDIVNTLRLWSARGTAEFDFEYFNHGDYEQAVYRKVLSENITKALYPNDAVARGHELRLRQEYFFTAAAISDIIRRFKVDNHDIHSLPDKVAIQLNDTHPALAIPEMMRILVDEEELGWNTAWDITRRCFAYTNHTVMPEALERWSVPLFERLLPRHLEIIYEINMRFLQEVSSRFPGDNARLERMSIIEESSPKKVRMANLAIVGSHSVNGVSRLHSDILKEDLFRDFYELGLQKFSNKTNGITQRRWLLKANPLLSTLISQAIGSSWVIDLAQAEKLLALKEDAGFREKWQDVKKKNKLALSDLILHQSGVLADPESMFDIQIKRIHEYKRQLLFCLWIIAHYLDLKKGSAADATPRTCIFGGKAAPGYYLAKLVIKFINNVADMINRDKSINGLLKVVFLENYRVSLAERIFPASDLSEQISTAGYEASGTGCMKFMVNGALTIGTFDGANIEIAEEVGKENVFMFGLTADEIKKIRIRGYRPQSYIEKSSRLSEIIGLMRSNYFCPFEPSLFDPIVANLTGPDPYLVCADFDSYLEAQDRVSRNYLDRTGWTKKSIINVAKSGTFSSDRTIKEYARDIWNVKFLDYA